jgi:hypothetical protein
MKNPHSCFVVTDHAIVYKRRAIQTIAQNYLARLFLNTFADSALLIIDLHRLDTLSSRDIYCILLLAVY